MIALIVIKLFLSRKAINESRAAFYMSLFEAY